MTGLQTPSILSDAAQAFAVSTESATIAELRKAAHHHLASHPLPDGTTFEDTWWLDRDGCLFIPRSVGVPVVVNLPTNSFIPSMPTRSGSGKRLSQKPPSCRDCTKKLERQMPRHITSTEKI
jgi:hypothetical protein